LPPGYNARQPGLAFAIPFPYFLASFAMYQSPFGKIALVSFVGALCACLMSAPLGAAEPGIPAGSQITYRGTLAKTDATADKSFDLLMLAGEPTDAGQPFYWMIEEKGRGAWPWLERFGVMTLDKAGQPVGAAPPAILYDYDGGTAVVSVPVPILPGEELAAGKNWEAGGLTYAVEKADKLEKRDVWLVQGSDRFGRNRTVYRDKSSPLAVGIDQRVFFNMGTEYQLQLRLIGIDKLADEEATQRLAQFTALTGLTAKLKRQRSQKPELTEDQIEVLAAELPKLQKAIAAGPLTRLVEAADQDLKVQRERTGGVKSLVEKFQGQPAGKFTVDQLSGDAIDSEALKNQVTVLHFWDYKDEPLEEPYGQVGYLDFLYGKRKDSGVKVLGVAVDHRLGDENTRGPAVRGIRKLKSFMNLSYPICLDHGPLVRKFGDPVSLGAKLPLVVVIGPDGKIVHYHLGFYKVERDRGLAELDQAITTALKGVKK